MKISQDAYYGDFSSMLFLLTRNAGFEERQRIGPFKKLRQRAKAEADCTR